MPTPPNEKTARLWNGARLIAAWLFVLAGAFKFLVPFGTALAQLGVPLPALFGVLVPLVEVLCGLGLVLRRKMPLRLARFGIARICAALLAFDMMAAIALVGLPGALGHPLRAGGHTIGDEVWRLPLEIALLVVAAHTALKDG